MRAALTIAGSDSGGGAGIQADLKTFAAFRIYGASAITSITAQNTVGVSESAALAADLVTAQIEAVAGDLQLSATKVGMLGTSAIVEAVAAAIDELELPLVVVDPVIASSRGEPLLDADGIQALGLELLPRARVITPNIPEAEAISGCLIRSAADARRAAERLCSMGAAAVIITGGHASGSEVIDLVFDGGQFSEVRTARVNLNGRTTHGTGCTYAAALAAGLALGQGVQESAVNAQQYVAGAIAHATAIGRGSLVLDHFWNGILKG